MNLLLSGSIYLSTKKDLYKKIGLFWFALIFNFFIQGMAQGDHLLIISCYGFSLVTTNLLAYASAHLISLKYPLKNMILLSLFAYATSILLCLIEGPTFFMKAMPISLGVSIPLLYISYQFLFAHRKESTLIMKIEAAVLVLMAIHSINFAIFRLDPDTQLWGWLVSYACYQCLAGLLPALSLDFYHRKEKARLKNEIADKTRHLKVANTELEDTLSEKTFLLRALVHDVSNPLTVILVKSQIFKKTPESEAFIDSIQKMAKKIQTIITQFRDFEKLHGKSDIFKDKRCNVSSAIDETVEMFQSKLEAKSLRINVNNDSSVNGDKIIEIKIDKEVFVSSVLGNFISNAIKFSQENSIININYVCSDTSLKISIINYGIGMNSEKILSLYDFETNETQLGTKGERGTGFGVPIANRIIEKANGKLTIVSNNDTSSGPLFTEMRIELPFIASTRSSIDLKVA